ncbi:MAG: SBBP repeat-containing protein [bacterium]
MKNLKLILIIISVMIYGQLYSQVSQLWLANYNSPTNGIDHANAMTIDNAGYIYVTGESKTNTTGNDYATVKYNSAGVQQWAARYNSQTNYSDVARGIVVDATGNVYVTGTRSLGAGYAVINTIKYNSSGVEQWNVRYGDSISNPTAAKNPIALDASGNVYVGGRIKLYQGDDGSQLLLKYTPSGILDWTRTFDPSIYPQGLGSGLVNVKFNGTYIIASGKAYYTDGLFNPLYTVVTTAAYDVSGNLQWMGNDTLTGGSDNLNDMSIDQSGNVLLTATYAYDMVTMKYSSTGTRLWKTYYTGIGGTYYDQCTGITSDPSGNVFVSGDSRRSTTNNSEDYVTLKYDPSGNLLWEKFYNGSLNSGDYAKDIAADAAGNVYVTGVALETGFNTNAVTVKYNAAGVQQWAKSLNANGTNQTDDAYLIAIDNAGDVIISGYSGMGVNTEDYITVKYGEAINVNLTCFIQGFYNSASNNQVSDTVRVNLRNSVSPYTVADNVRTLLSSTGIGAANFPNASAGTYYVEVTHRNGLKTWSATAVVMSIGGTFTNDLSTAQTQAYGNNLIQIDASPLRYGIYNGDINQDETIDVTDVVGVFNDINNFISGYTATDLTGDNFTDVTDLLIAYNNSVNFVAVSKP